MAIWNPWHGCHKLSDGCQNCYVYRIDERHGRDSTLVTRTKTFSLPIKRNRKGKYKLEGGQTVYTCFTSDFFLKEADEWRREAWKIIRQRPDLHFIIITKRVDRFFAFLPSDWGEGYGNVSLGCTMENQYWADKRIPFFPEVPVCYKYIICEPLLGPIDFAGRLGPWVQQLVVGGESGHQARVCKYEWILDIHRQCAEAGVAFRFKQTGANFQKDGKRYHIPRKYQHSQARKAGIDFL